MKKIAAMVLAGVLAAVPVSTTSGQPERKLQQTQMKAKG